MLGFLFMAITVDLVQLTYPATFSARYSLCWFAHSLILFYFVQHCSCRQVHGAICQSHLYHKRSSREFLMILDLKGQAPEIFLAFVRGLCHITLVYACIFALFQQLLATKGICCGEFTANLRLEVQNLLLAFPFPLLAI